MVLNTEILTKKINKIKNKKPKPNVFDHLGDE